MTFSCRVHSFVLIFSFAMILTASCANQPAANSTVNTGGAAPASNSNASPRTVAKDDAAELNTLVILPFAPDETLYMEEADAANSNAKKLTAVLKFTTDDAKKLIEQAARHRQPESVQIGAEGWFPAELAAQTQLSGDQTLKGTAYGANDFIQMPYKTGRLIKVENSDYFILELASN